MVRDMGHMLGPMSHVSIAILVRLLLAMTINIWDTACGPFRPIFAVFAILSQVGNTISPWGKGPSKKNVVILAVNDQGSIALELRICSSDLAGVMQLTMRATLPNLLFLAVFSPVGRPSSRGAACS